LILKEKTVFSVQKLINFRSAENDSPVFAFFRVG